MVKDMPAHVWSNDLVDAADPGSAAFYNFMDGIAVFRPENFNDAQTVFHEALHAATSRAIDGSERLTHLLSKLQDYIEELLQERRTGCLASRAPMRSRSTREGERVNPHEFISELFTRNDVAAMVKGVELTDAQSKPS